MTTDLVSFGQKQFGKTCDGQLYFQLTLLLTQEIIFVTHLKNMYLLELFITLGYFELCVYTFITAS